MSLNPQIVMPKRSETVSSSFSRTSQSLQTVTPRKLKKLNILVQLLRKSPRLSQSVEKEDALPGKLVMPEIDWNKICGGSKKKDKREYFTIMYGGKPIKILAMQDTSSDSEEVPVDRSSAKEDEKKTEC